jgi:hypothetical protein
MAGQIEGEVIVTKLRESLRDSAIQRLNEGMQTPTFEIIQR